MTTNSTPQTDTTPVTAWSVGDSEYRSEIEAATAQEAAEKWCSAFDGGESTYWVHVLVWPAGDPDGADGDACSSQSVAVEPVEPPCAASEDHRWEAPLEVVGGIRENPGVWGQGGGVTVTEACALCGRYRVVDTWATDPVTGEQGLRSTEYRDADSSSEEWVASHDDEDVVTW